MTVDIYQSDIEFNEYQWAPANNTNPWMATVNRVREIGKTAFCDWFYDADYHGFTREQIDLLAAVLRLNGIEVIER